MFSNTEPARPAKQLLYLVLAMNLVSAGETADRHGMAKWITEGAMPAMELDSQDRLYPIYAAPNDRVLYYRVGDLNGNFGAPEIVLTASRLWNPQMVYQDGRLIR